ncbi:MAG: capsular biosynthesis protein [Hyphomicrobiaceae bacterium]|nr:capsular biosynthesis protein [Hyphomicrobiaceae bacterium]
MIDRHCHILPGIDDGARDRSVSLEMARAYVAQGVTHVACTPHILPGLYHNSGLQIRTAVAELQDSIDAEGLPLRLLTGADNHVVPNFVAGLQSGHLLTLANSRYVLVEPPHHVAPPQLDSMFFNILIAGYVPILSHPERLTWIEHKYSLMQQLAAHGVWMQITSGSLNGRFGRRALCWAERMLEEGLVHIVASDAHAPFRRPPDLAEGRQFAARRVGELEAEHLVVTRPNAILNNTSPFELPPPTSMNDTEEIAYNVANSSSNRTRHGLRIGERLRRLFS